MSDQATVYVVDDDAAAANSLHALLFSSGFSVEVCHSAEEFLNAYDGLVKGCLVLDVRLEGMSGLALQKKLISRGLELPMIVISGHADDQVREEALANGAVEFLAKPFDGNRLCEIVRQVLPN